MGYRFVLGMDPGGMMNQSGPFNLAEIWHLPTSGGSESRMRRAAFGAPGFGESNLDVSTSNPVHLDHVTLGKGRKRREAEEESAKAVSTSYGNANALNDIDAKRIKVSGCREENRGSKTQDESAKSIGGKNQPPEPPKDYIHVRARRGQATDSHSLAERARREKISERMKILQDLVPGCNKVIGKALVLDEIINYIQSLQRQVEFLSMKLEAVNSRMTPETEYGQHAFVNPDVAFGSQSTTRGASPEWLHMQIGGGFNRTS